MTRRYGDAMIDKTEIKCRFRKSIDSYDENAYVQKIIVDKLCRLIDETVSYEPVRLLEIGCGTGLMTKNMAKRFGTDTLFINDLVEEMCDKTATDHRIPKTHCLVGDIEQTELKNSFDLMVSTSTFQWLSQPSSTFGKLASALHSGNILAFSSFGKHNLKELRTTTGNGLYYRTKEKVSALLEPYFDIITLEEELHTLYFSSPLEVLQHLKKTGVNASSSTEIWTPRHLNRFIQDYGAQHAIEGRCPLTYHPLYFICRKR